MCLANPVLHLNLHSSHRSPSKKSLWVSTLLISHLHNFLFKPLSLPHSQIQKYQVGLRNGLGKKNYKQWKESKLQRTAIAWQRMPCTSAAVQDGLWATQEFGRAAGVQITRSCSLGDFFYFTVFQHTTSPKAQWHWRSVSTLTENIDKKPVKAVILRNRDGNAKNTGKLWICISSWLCVAKDESSVRSINRNTDSL